MPVRILLAAMAALVLTACSAATAQPPAIQGSVDRIVVEKAAHRGV